MENLIRTGYALIIAAIQCALMKYAEVAMPGIIVIGLLLGGLITVMGHKRLGYGMLFGTILYAGFALLFGYLFMEGWLSPQDYLNKK
jgi:hypothetical protein